MRKVAVGQRSETAEEEIIKLGCEDRVEFRYVEGRRGGLLIRRNSVSNGVEVGLNGALKTANSTLSYSR